MSWDRGKGEIAKAWSSAEWGIHEADTSTKYVFPSPSSHIRTTILPATTVYEDFRVITYHFVKNIVLGPTEM